MTSLAECSLQTLPALGVEEAVQDLHHGVLLFGGELLDTPYPAHQLLVSGRRRISVEFAEGQQLVGGDPQGTGELDGLLESEGRGCPARSGSR
jgi:hypothetical protein